MTMTKYLLGLCFFLLGAGSLMGQNWYEQGKAAEQPMLQVDYFTKALNIGERTDNWLYFRRGWAYYNAKRYQRAIRDFQKGQEVEGTLKNAFLLAGLAWCYYELGEYPKALALAEGAIAEMPSNTRAWNAKGWCLIGMNRDEDALAAFDEYVRLAPDEFVGYSNRSYAYMQVGQYENVIRDCDQALAMIGESEFLIERKAFAMMKLDRKQDAIQLLRDKITYEPNDPASTWAFGELFYRNEDYDEAIRYHTTALSQYERKVREDKEFIREFRDNLYEIYLSRGQSHDALKNYQRALADYKKATETKEDDYRAWYEMGALQTYQENWYEGARAYERAFELRPDLKFGWVNLGFCYGKLNNLERAVSAYSRGIKNNPKVGLLYNNRGFVYLEMKKYELALGDLKKAIEVEPEVVMSHVSLGEYYYDRKDYGSAIAKLNEALGMEEGSDQAYTVAYFTRGMCYLDQEQFAPAIRDFLSAIKIQPDHVLAHEGLGIAYYESEKLCDSYKALRKALDLEKTVPHERKTALESPKYLGKMTRNPCQ